MYFILQWCDIINKYCKKKKTNKKNTIFPIKKENKENKENNDYDKNLNSDIIFKFKNDVEPVNQLEIDNSTMFYRKNRPSSINIQIKSNS